MDLFLGDRRQVAAERGGLQIGPGDAVELLQPGGVADLVVALEDIEPVAAGGDLRQADPALPGALQRVADGAPFLGCRLVGEELDGALGIVLPFALDGDPERVAVEGHALGAEAGGTLDERLGEGHFLDDRALGVHAQKLVRHVLLEIALAGEPEAAFAVGGDAFEVERLGRLAVTGDDRPGGDAGRLLRRVDGEDRRLAGVEAVADRVERGGAVGVGGKAGEGAPADRAAVGIVFGDDHRIGVLALAALVDHHVGAGAAILDEIGLVGGDQQVARRDGDGALGGDARRQKLGEDGIAVAEPVDADGRAALGQDEGVGRAVEGGDFQTLGLDALGVGALVRIMAGADHLVFEGRAGFPGDAAVPVPDGEGARAAVVVAFIGGDEAVVVDPLDGVGLALAAGLAAGEGECAVVLGVDAVEIDGAGGKVGGDFAGRRVDDGEMVVLLQRDDDLAGLVEVDIFGLRIFRRDVGKAGQLDLRQGGAVGHAVGQLDDGEEAGRHLRQGAVVEVLVALVLDGDGGIGAVLRDRDGIGLAAEIAGGRLGLVHDVDHGQAARRRGVVRRGVDADKDVAAGHRHGGRLAVHRQEAAGLRGLRIGDVDQADAAGRAVGVDQGVAVGAGGDDLRGGFGLGGHVGRQVAGDREAGDAPEHRLGHRGGRRGERAGGEKGGEAEAERRDHGGGSFA